MITTIIASIVAIIAFAFGSRYSEKEHAVQEEIHSIHRELREMRNDLTREIDDRERSLNTRIDIVDDEMRKIENRMLSQNKKKVQ